VGLSAGGYGATILGLHHLARFAAIESWSGYFAPTDPTGSYVIRREATASAVNLLVRVKAQERRLPTFLGLYVGNDDTLFRSDNVEFDAQLSRARIPHVFAVYPGGHTTSLWKAHATVWLGLALHHLSPPR
jgi:enterochelin esterase-like enzyme